jgi:transposase
VVLQQALADCDAAYKNFFDSVKGKRAGARMGPPRFKKRTAAQSIRFTRNARFRVLESGRLRLPKIGDLKVAWSRHLPSEPTSVTVAKTATGKYFASFVVALDGDEVLPPVEAETGIDLGLKDFAVFSGGRVIESPRFFARIDRYFPSTRLCSVCGVLAGPKGLAGLGVREWVCGCGAVHDRDANAALNILREGQRMVAAGQAETRNASGGQVRPGISGTARNTRIAGQNEEPTRTRLVSTSR